MPEVEEIEEPEYDTKMLIATTFTDQMKELEEKVRPFAQDVVQQLRDLGIPEVAIPIAVVTVIACLSHELEVMEHNGLPEGMRLTVTRQPTSIQTDQCFFCGKPSDRGLSFDTTSIQVMPACRPCYDHITAGLESDAREAWTSKGCIYWTPNGLAWNDFPDGEPGCSNEEEEAEAIR